MSALVGRACGCIILLAAMAVAYIVLVRTAAGQRFDERALLTLRGTGAHNDLPNAVGLGSVTDPRLWVVAVVAIIVLGLLARRRWSIAVLLCLPIAVIIAARLLRDVLLTRPELIDSQFPHVNSFPSGHAAAAGGCVAAIVRAAPRPVQPIIVVAGAMWLTLVSQDLMVWGWHRPGDLIGSILLASAVMFLVPNSPSRIVGSPWHGVVLMVAAVAAPLGWSAYVGQPIIAAVGIVAAVALSALFVGRDRQSSADGRFHRLRQPEYAT